MIPVASPLATIGQLPKAIHASCTLGLHAMDLQILNAGRLEGSIRCILCLDCFSSGEENLFLAF
jgi:hypothetical protein